MSKADLAGVRQFTVRAEDDGIRLDRWFKRHMPEASFAIVSRWARTGQLRVDGARATPGDRIAEGQTLRVPPLDVAAAKEAAKAPRPRPILTEDQISFAESLVIHRDAQALVINKPPGLATQGGTKTHEHVDGLLDALMFERDDRPRLVHRLDKDTSGALLLARTSRSAAHFAKSFSSRTARKVYWAIIMGVPSVEDGLIDLPLAKQPGTGGEKMHVDEKEGLPARTRYRVIERAGNRACWVELQPHTGRTHQLRVHMAEIGHPIVGDGKYGGKEAFLSGSISRKMHLHARRIRIDHPDGSPLDVKAEPPSHFAETLASLGFDVNEGDLPLEIDIQPTASDRKAADKRAATAHSKDMRKARRGERRSRSAPDKPVRSKGPDKPRSKGGKPAGPTARPGAKRPTGGARPRKPARD
ncbi:MAG: RluA family pseudouridine synthase [Alphaproteobacteria bacterium]|nr:RluA family pseudouridine synthase [Alphaproteobacteria bacterium]MBU0794730.1 RluA family pseudouridine synthase [Alphaproteobacteria bacterium]MBU0875460.1 RluA family pseudouridine synthase [Alphaproteobacteria bacterium]MBU1771413.1 RluA family pseudouridine synthase [Alphaproteobacteria bacterium]